MKDFKDLKAGIKGTIVLKYNDFDFEVEFFDKNHNSLGVFTISKDYLEVYWKNSDYQKNTNTKSSMHEKK